MRNRPTPRAARPLSPPALLALVLAAGLGAVTGCATPTPGGRARAMGAAAPSPPPTAAAPFQRQMDSAMAAMHHAMAAVRLTGNPDHDFAAMMIPHHQAAVDMARAELLAGTDPVMRRLAQEIIVTQESEIAVMRAALQQELKR